MYRIFDDIPTSSHRWYSYGVDRPYKSASMTDSPLINLFDYEARARQVLAAAAYGYFVGGAADEVTVRANREAFERVRLGPRVLVDVSRVDTRVTILGRAHETPIIIAPMALARLAHDDGELAIRRAAAGVGVTYTVSTWSTLSLEQIAAQAIGRLWFQLYVYKDRAVTRRLVELAEYAGYEALMLTVDVPVAGKRERDARNRFALPPHIQLANFVDTGLAEVADQQDDSAIAAYATSQVDPALTWTDVAWLRSITRLPVIVKGVLRADDARRAVDHGAAAVVVSNHGGRQLDTAVASLDALPEIAQAVGEQIDVLIDGGVRRGTDVLKAIALGAKGVLVGRPVMWGLAVDGENGVRDVLSILHGEFVNAMMLCGCPSVREITRDLIAP